MAADKDQFKYSFLSADVWGNDDDDDPDLLRSIEFTKKAISSVAPSKYDDNVCECGGLMDHCLDGINLVCSVCSRTTDSVMGIGEDEESLSIVPSSSQLRIIGSDSKKYQSDLFRSGTGTTIATQIKSTLAQYRHLQQMHVDSGGRSFPDAAFVWASSMYAQVIQGPKVHVIRSQNKLATMANLLLLGCIRCGFAPAKKDIAAFMQLRTNGIAKGYNLFSKFATTEKVDVEVNPDLVGPEIMTCFSHYGYENKEWEHLRDAVKKIVNLATDKCIGCESIIRTKVVATTYVVFKRCIGKNRELVADPGSLSEFCGTHIRKYTADRFVKVLSEYHSHFKHIYEEYGLDAQ